MRPYAKQPKSNEELVALLQSRGLAADTRQRSEEFSSFNLPSHNPAFHLDDLLRHHRDLSPSEFAQSIPFISAKPANEESQPSPKPPIRT